MGDSKDTLNQIFNNRYEIRQKLGTGGMARVYLGYDTNLGREVAIKVLHEHLAEDTMFKERFEREARFVATLNHPNIVQVYDYATGQRAGENICYMVMSLVQGKSLKEILENATAKESFLPHSQVLTIMTDLCGALQYAHDKGMVHRDIKPANVIITDDGKTILTDFGIARMTQGTQFTQEGMTVGTPSYMSPEQATGAQVDSRSDIYALGIMLYEMLVGHPPFHDDGTLSVLLKHMTEPVPSISHYDFIDNPHLDAVIMKALAKQPETRYQTANDLLDDLKRAFNGQETSAEKFMNSATVQLQAIAPEPDKSSKKPATPSRGIWMAMSLGLGIILAIVVLGMMSRNNPAPTNTPAPTPEYFITTFSGDDPFTTRLPQDNSAGLIRQITPQGYQITNNRTRQAVATVFNTSIPYDNFIIRLSGQLNPDSAPASGYGIVFRYVDENNYNVFAVDGLGRYSIWVRQNGEWIELRATGENWTPDEAIMPIGQPNNLEIEVFENNLVGYVNGMQVVMVTDDSISAGGIGIYVASTSESQTDVTVMSYGVMEASSSMTDSMTGVESMTGGNSMTDEETATPEVSSQTGSDDN
ncbi:MAG: protein kinase [Anaerolineae bacterium]|nr:protein kinase [Anaerolineae bacterium]